MITNKISGISVIAGWLFLWLLIFYFFSTFYQYQLYFIEQNQLFLFTIEESCKYWEKPGGISLWIARFITQFFIYPFAGPFFIATAIICTCLLYRKILSFLSNNLLPVFYLTPCLLLFFCHADVHYLLQGTIAILLFEFLLIYTISIRKKTPYVIFSIISLLILYWIAGAIFFIYAICLAIYSFTSNRSYFKFCLLLLMLTCLLLFISYRYLYITLWLPDMYIPTHSSGRAMTYLWWIYFPAGLLLSALFNKFKSLRNRLSYILQILIFCVSWRLLLPVYGHLSYQRIYHMDYLVYTEQWDTIIQEGKEYSNPTPYLPYISLAFAHKGILPKAIQMYKHTSPGSLFVPWNHKMFSALLLSDIYFSTGNTGGAQHMAFEGYILSKYGNTRLLKRLIQTNLIFGNYPVAEKYMCILEKSMNYKQWVSAHKKFLYNDEAIEKDTLLGNLRKSIIPEDYFYSSMPIEQELLLLSQTNPNGNLANQYLQAFQIIQGQNTFSAK